MSNQTGLQAVQKQLYETLQAYEKLLEQKYEMADRIGKLVNQNRELLAWAKLIDRVYSSSQSIDELHAAMESIPPFVREQ